MPSRGKQRSAAQQSPVTIRMSEDERKALDAVAAKQGVPISFVLREAVRPVLQPHMGQST
jgi:uncharacterized protein (DUF1778 family)